MKEYINPNHYQTEQFGTNSGLIFIYQSFLKSILDSKRNQSDASIISPVIREANNQMLAFLKGTANKYAFRAGRKLYENRTMEESILIDKKKESFYRDEILRIISLERPDVKGLAIPAFSPFPAIVEYGNYNVSRLTEYLTFIGKE